MSEADRIEQAAQLIESARHATRAARNGLPLCNAHDDSDTAWRRFRLRTALESLEVAAECIAAAKSDNPRAKP